MAHFPYRSIFFPQEGFEWHNEDAWGVSRRYPIYAVADGVTLPAEAELVGTSPAKRAATTFCRSAIRFFEERYEERISQKLFREAYEGANEDIGTLNTKRTQPFSAVGALALVRNKTLFLSRLTDCGGALIRGGALVFKTPEFWAGVKRTGDYRVLSGERPVGNFVEVWRMRILPRDTLVLFTDGFEHHFEEKSFVRLFRISEPNHFKERIETFDEKCVERNPTRFGHERTLLAVRL